MTYLTSDSPFSPIPLPTLLTDQPTRQPIIPGLLPQGLTLLLGQSILGKSWLALHLALQTALSQPVLGQLPMQGAQVLYLGLQDTPSRMSSRCHKLLGDRPIPNGFCWTNRWNPLHSDALASLDTWLTNHPQTRLVVIDSLAQLHPSFLRSASTTAQDCALLHQLQDLATRHQLAILLVHSLPTRANRDPLTELTRTPALCTADALLILKRERGQSDATLLITGPDLPEQELALSLSQDSMQWTLLGNAADYRLSQQRQDILAVLREYSDGPLSPKQIASLLHKDVRAVTKLLFDMSHAHQLRLVGRGQYMLATTHSISGNNPEHLPQPLPQSPSPATSISNGNDSNDGHISHEIGNDGNVASNADLLENSLPLHNNGLTAPPHEDDTTTVKHDPYSSFLALQHHSPPNNLPQNAEEAAYDL